MPSTDATEHRAITGLILAGGRATRMGGEDKGLILLNNKPMIAHSTSHLQTQVDAIIINANRNKEIYRQYSPTVIGDPDGIDDYAGPLAGMLAGLEHCTTELLLTIPCDSPLLANNYAARMTQTLLDSGADLVVAAADGTGGRRLQPVFALLSTRLAPQLRTYLSEGGRKIDRWFAQQSMAISDFSDQPSMFENINTPEELAAAEATLRDVNKR